MSGAPERLGRGSESGEGSLEGARLVDFVYPSEYRQQIDEKYKKKIEAIVRYTYNT